jgi:hypothetical protein
MPVMNLTQPGMALTPDGGTLAIASADAPTVTLIDTATMKARSTVSLHGQSSILDRLGSVLGIAPDTAAAKEMDGAIVTTAFGPDGHTLYLTGLRGSLSEDDVQRTTGLGIRAIDTRDGTILAEGLPDTQVTSLDFVAGGSGIYALSSDTPSLETGVCPCTLRRLDGATLHTTAERRFISHPAVIVGQ